MLKEKMEIMTVCNSGQSIKGVPTTTHIAIKAISANPFPQERNISSVEFSTDDPALLESLKVGRCFSIGIELAPKNSN